MLAFAALIIIAVSGVTAAVEAYHTLPAVCPPGWLAWRHSCYILLADRMNWSQASKLCDRPGSSLVVPDCLEEHDFIWREMKEWMEEFVAKNDTHKLKLWIGCKDLYNERQKLVCSGSKDTHVYENWAADEPDDSTKECVKMAKKRGGQWSDGFCANRAFVVCEMRVSRRVYCLPSDADGRFTPQCLLNHHTKSLATTGVTRCSQACWAEPRCHSFNLWQQANNTKICQLNNATRLEADVTDFKQVQSCTFFEL